MAMPMRPFTPVGKSAALDLRPRLAGVGRLPEPGAGPPLLSEYGVRQRSQLAA